ncbi:MAG: methylated-DNA--[protein]-cysteine S-methyltransferase [Candidatus Neomarinimicrobiota bacterium]|nr:methylated-DNA--[protein]-cysteine S-methyltransferase [Candidatus Neomarinimicrobiota bacterium]
MLNYSIISSPIGKLCIVKSNKGVRRILFANNYTFETYLQNNFPHEKIVQNNFELKRISNQIHEYFDLSRKEFSLDIDIQLSSFYRTALTKVVEIPYGETSSYKSIAIKTGNPNASRAVGNANANNPLPIIIPCHRVIANDGSIGGYGGGLQTKRFLLELEGAL